MQLIHNLILTNEAYSKARIRSFLYEGIESFRLTAAVEESQLRCMPQCQFGIHSCNKFLQILPRSACIIRNHNFLYPKREEMEINRTIKKEGGIRTCAEGPAIGHLRIG